MPDITSLSQLLEASIGTPEQGAVNFGQLHKLLLEIINRLDHGDHPTSSATRVSDLDARKEAKMSSPGFQKSSYNALSEKVGKIERELTHMSTALPDSKQMIEKVKTDTPLTDLWQHVQLGKKVEANEDGIRTAMGLIQQLIKDMSELKDENKDLRNKLAQIDMDDINAQLRKLDKLRDEMDAMSKVASKLDDMDDLRSRVNALQKKISDHDEELNRLSALPQADEIVTWPGLEDGLNGVRGEFAAYRPESRTARAVESETKATSMTPTPTSAPTRPHSASRSSSRPRSNLSDGPSQTLVTDLESLGTLNKRHEELKKRVDELEKEMAEKANKDDVSGKSVTVNQTTINNELPDDLLDRIDWMSNKLSELDDLRAKQSELGVLLADVPLATDPHPPTRGDKSRASSIFMGVDEEATGSDHKRHFSSFSSTQPTDYRRSSSVRQSPRESRRGEGRRGSAGGVGNDLVSRDGVRPGTDETKRVSVGGGKDRDGVGRDQHVRHSLSAFDGGQLGSEHAIAPPSPSSPDMASPSPLLPGIHSPSPTPLSDNLTGVTSSTKDVVDVKKKESSLLKRPRKDSSISNFVVTQPGYQSAPESMTRLPFESRGRFDDKTESAARLKSSQSASPKVDTANTKSAGQQQKHPVKKVTIKGDEGGRKKEVPVSGTSVFRHAGKDKTPPPPAAGIMKTDERSLPVAGLTAMEGKPSQSPQKPSGGATFVKSSQPSRRTPDAATTGDKPFQSTKQSVQAMDGFPSAVQPAKQPAETKAAAPTSQPKRQSVQAMDAATPSSHPTKQAVPPVDAVATSRRSSQPPRPPSGSSADPRRSVRAEYYPPTTAGQAKGYNRRSLSTAKVQPMSDVPAPMVPMHELPEGVTNPYESSFHHNHSVHDTASLYGPSLEDSKPRFSRTLREVMHDDYMPEIFAVKARLNKLEEEIPRLHLKFVDRERENADNAPIVQYVPSGDDDKKFSELIKHINNHQRTVNNRLSDVDQAVHAIIDKTPSDAGSIKRAQAAISDLQEELNKLQKLVDFLSQENDQKTQALKKLSDDTALLEQTKADKDYVDAEVDVKADKSQIDGKVNRSLFESSIGDLQKIIDDLLAKLLAYEEAWKKAHEKVEEDVDGKIDRTELDRLKAYLDRKLRELNSKLRQNSGAFNPFCEDAAGLKKQLLPFNCLSCDKPVVVSNAANQLTQSSPGGVGDAFTANKSARPYTTFELDQIRQHAKSEQPPGTNAINFARSLNEQNIAQLRRNNLKAYLVHFGDTLGPKVFITRSKQRMVNPDVPDPYLRQRQCGGKHTKLTSAASPRNGNIYTNNIIGKTKCLKDLFQEEEFVAAGALNRNEQMLFGADGKNYKGSNDIITFDEKLTQVLQEKADPIRSLNDEVRKHGHSRGAEENRSTTLANNTEASDPSHNGFLDESLSLDVSNIKEL